MAARGYACLLGAVAVLAPGCRESPGGARSGGSAAEPPGAFAYVDPGGTELLALSTLENPATILGAVCSEARVLPARYERTQGRQEADNGRQVASNFANDEGAVFRLIRGSARPSETCYLSADSVLLARAVAVHPLGLSACSGDHAARLAVAKSRTVARCWRVAQMPSDAELLAVQFATVDTSALASLVLMRDAALVFHDFPATYRGPDEDVWRADDQGAFAPEDFAILFVVPSPGAYALALTWAAAEGESEHFLVADSGAAFRAVVSDYRYWAPQ